MSTRTVQFILADTKPVWSFEGDTFVLNLSATLIQGDDGPAIELQVIGGYIQWRVVGASTWTNLIATSALKGDPGNPGSPGEPGDPGAPGDDGATLELQVSGGYIQWRPVTGGTWTNLIATSALKGADGTNGTNGTNGQNATTFADATARAAAVPGFFGQLGLQLDTLVLYRGTALTAGSWAVYSTSSGSARWTEILAAHFTATPASTSTLTFGTDDTGVLIPGLPVRYTIGGTIYYGQVVSCAANLLTIRGAPLSGDVTKLEYGTPDMIEIIHASVPGLFEDATNTGLLASDCFTYLRWNKPASYCVGFDFKEETADSGATQPNVNVRWAGNRVSTANTNAGPLLTASVQGTTVLISTAYYAVPFQAQLEIETTKGSNGDAVDLSLDIVMVTP